MFPIYYLACILAMLGSAFLFFSYVAHEMVSERKAARHDKQSKD